ncbi:MAG: cyclic nucleotide-binding domain-containing protein [Cyanobacteria bacterium NC_groundwater_1444_Ag_S-0.65um_54_12]|nr:cyclic nucleotide-binding domain-containing protein [Cyanobacteria bacterium NC_groundwater_1444_Ag_S-0.65um_54_12]
MEVLEQLLANHPFLLGLKAKHLNLLAGCAARQEYGRGDFLFREGTEADQMFLLHSGRVTLEIHQPGIGEIQLESLLPGDVLGWSCLFPPYRWHVDARALEPAVVLILAGDCLRPKLDADPELGYAVTKRLLNKVHERLEHVRMQRLDLYNVRPGERIP